jgi:hypothetical protein
MPAVAAVSWQDRGFATVRMLCLMFVRVAGWLALLTRPAASEDAGLTEYERAARRSVSSTATLQVRDNGQSFGTLHGQGTA